MIQIKGTVKIQSLNTADYKAVWNKYSKKLLVKVKLLSASHLFVDTYLQLRS